MAYLGQEYGRSDHLILMEDTSQALALRAVSQYNSMRIVVDSESVERKQNVQNRSAFEQSGIDDNLSAAITPLTARIAFPVPDGSMA
jgi:hypothetical protein